MGIFSLSGAPSYSPELPIASGSRDRRDSSIALPNLQRRTSSVSRPAMGRRNSSIVSAGSDDGRRRSSFMPTLRNQPSMPAITEDQVGRVYNGVNTQTQTTFLGRRVSQAIVPAFSRRASLAHAEKDRDPTHLRLGETDRGSHDVFAQSFFNARLSIDEAGPEERAALQEKIAQLREDKAREKQDWSSRLGWDVGPPRSSRKHSHHRKSTAAGKQPAKGKKRSKRHREKRAQKELDTHLDAYNAFAQNGLRPVTMSTSGNQLASMLSSANLSMTSVDSAHLSRAVSNATGPLDREQQLGEARARAVPVGDGFDALDVMADHIFRVGVQEKKWFKAPRMGVKRDGVATGVSIRARPGLYRTFPVDYEPMMKFEEAVSRLNPEVAIKVDSAIVRNIMRTYIDPIPEMAELVIDANTRIQILDEISHLARARKHQYAAFVREEGVLVVWADVVEAIIPAAEILEDSLMHFIWRGEEENRKANQAMQIAEAEKADAEKEDGASVADEALDPEDVAMKRLKKQWRERPQVLIAPITDALSIMTVFALIGLGLRSLVSQYTLDGKPARFGLFAFAPLLICIATFACEVLIGSIAQIFGPVRQLTQNSRYYSGVAPKRTMGELQHVTVQLPVYKESLDEVIRPTIESLKKAITTYERQGGSCSILVCDDGLQLLSKAEADQRRAFYYDNNIAYVARPGHNVDGFIRKGRFKKAGNMNYAISLSLRVEEIMDELRPAAQEARRAKDPEAFWGDTQENAVYDTALKQVLEEKAGEAWAAGNIRMGHYILIIDSDTRVPEDCFADAVSEMVESPEVAIIQHASGVMQVAFHYFENGIAHFTRSIQTAISYCCASGEVAPFVGHNAFLRWSALQECMFVDKDDGRLKIWSEDHVSEDFQIAVTLQMKGYTIRWASYTNGEFEEGVSLTCDDELNRWQKYSWGCSELLFHPFRQWFTKGPITPLFHNFAWSCIPIHSKFTICGYIFSYYAIGCAWVLTIMNYFVEGWNIPVDGYYLPSWNVTLVCIILFVGISNVAFVTLRYRLKMPDAGHMSWEQIKWIPFFSVFFTGMSLPIGAALISHLVGYQMTWSTTVKTVEKSNFFLQIPIIWKRFWPQLSLFFVMVVAMIIFAVLPQIPSGYRITNIEVIVPLSIIAGSHLLYPFALNPWFLSFSF